MPSIQYFTILTDIDIWDLMSIYHGKCCMVAWWLVSHSTSRTHIFNAGLNNHQQTTSIYGAQNYCKYQRTSTTAQIFISLKKLLVIKKCNLGYYESWQHLVTPRAQISKFSLDERQSFLGASEDYSVTPEDVIRWCHPSQHGGCSVCTHDSQCPIHYKLDLEWEFPKYSVISFSALNSIKIDK